MSSEEKEENDKKLILLGYERCDKCKKLYKKIKELSKDGKKKLCSNCKRNEITNKWFVPKEQRIKGKRTWRIGKYTISSQEELVLWKKYVTAGSTYYGAWCKVRGRKKLLQYIKTRQLKERWKKKQEEKNKMKQDINNSKEFLKGLGYTKNRETNKKNNEFLEGLK